MTLKEYSQEENDLLDKVRECFTKDKEFWNDVYQNCLDDMLFMWDCDSQWQDYIRQQRDFEGKPSLVFNELYIGKKAIVNRQQTNKIAIQVDAGNNESSIDTAEFLQNATRAVENKSKAYIAYEWAFDCAVSGGIGFYRILTDYESVKTFDQEPKIEQILNPFSVIYDRRSKKHDFSDAEHCCIYTKVSRKEHDELADCCNTSQFSIINDKNFIDKDECVIVEYFYKYYTTKTLVKLDTGEEVFLEDYIEIPKERILQKEKRQIPTIKWLKTNGYDIFEQTEWVGDFIPIIACIGEYAFIDGKRWFFGIVKNSKQPQLMLNYWVSQQTHMLGLLSKATWIGAKGSFTDPRWLDANITDYAFMEYDIVYDDNQNPLPPPQRTSYELSGLQNLVQQSDLASNYIKTTSGVYNASLGAPSNESSGRAIDKRNAQTEVTNYNYANNLEASIEYCGTVLVNLILKLWQEPSHKRVMLESGEQKIVAINQPFKDKGKDKIIDLSKGEYQVTVTAGASYANKRQEQAALTLSLMQVSPIVQQNPLVAYHYAKNIGAEEVADAIYKTLPPELKEEDNNEKAPVPPEIQQKIQQDAQTIEQLTQALNDEKDKSEAKSLDLESKERISQAQINSNEKINTENNQIKLVIEEMKTDLMHSQTLFTEQMRQIQTSINMLAQKEQLEKEHELEREQMAQTGQNLQPAPNASVQPPTATAGATAG